MTQPAVSRCPTCGAPADPRSAAGGALVCAYCRSPLPAPSTHAQLLLALDLADNLFAGWSLPERAYLSRPSAHPSPLVGRFPPRPTPWTLLRSEGTFDACELVATVRFLEADERATFGLSLRANPAGTYLVILSFTGFYTIMYAPLPAGPSVTLVAWSPCSALRPGLGVANEVAVTSAGDRLSLRVNGRDVAALRDNRSLYGAVELFASSQQGPVALAVDALDVLSVDLTPTPLTSALAPSLGSHIDVVLTACGSNKIMLIKLVREQTGLGLREAKDLVESAPTVLRAGLDRADADHLQRLVAEVGGRAELRSATTVTARRSDVVLTGARPAQKIQLIAAVRNITGLGLAAAKTLVENVPCEVKTGLSAEEAASAKRVLENAGGVVELRG